MATDVESVGESVGEERLSTGFPTIQAISAESHRPGDVGENGSFGGSGGCHCRGGSFTTA